MKKPMLINNPTDLRPFTSAPITGPGVPEGYTMHDCVTELVRFGRQLDHAFLSIRQDPVSLRLYGYTFHEEDLQAAQESLHRYPELGWIALTHPKTDEGLEKLAHDIEVLLFNIHTPKHAPVLPGIYEHYEGKRYMVLMETIDHGTGRTRVVYVPLYTRAWGDTRVVPSSRERTNFNINFRRAP